MGDMETRLVDGQVLKHHSAESCAAPCALHSPLPGPWENWPLGWTDTEFSDVSILVRYCPCGNPHPVVESFPYWVKTGKQERAKHYCCGCPCVPDGVLGPFLRLTRPPVFVPEPERQEEVKAEPTTEPDPNVVAKKYLEQYRISIPPDIYKLLEEQVGYHAIYSIREREEKDSEYTHAVNDCESGCADYFKAGDTDTDDNACITLKLAILGGYVPQVWEIDP